jgi:DnaJ family protein A protein 2
MAKKHCDVCHGHGVHQVSKVLEVNIEPGLHHGDTVVLENKGDHIPRTRPGDVVFHLRMLHPDPFFTRKGNDLENVLSISLLEALVGFKRKLIHVDGHSVVHLDRQEMVHPKTIWRIPSKGMPIKGHKGSFGDLLIHFTIEYPSELDTSQIEAIKILLPVETS